MIKFTELGYLVFNNYRKKVILNNWSIFSLDVLVAILFLYLPSFLMFKSLKLENHVSFALSPVLSIVVYGVLSIIYGALKVYTNFYSLFVPYFLFSSLFIALRCKRSGFGSVTFRNFCSMKWVLLYAGIGVLLGVYLFLIPMGDAAGMDQTYDDLFHYALMRNFLTSGDYSILHCSMYADLNPIISYYPAGLHLIVASVSSATNSSILIANNAVLFVVISIVWTSGWLYLLDTLFPDNSTSLVVGSFLSLACVSFPWLFLTYGRISPNLLSFSLLPATLAIFVNTFKSGVSKNNRVLYFVLVVICGSSAVFTQPNFIFSCMVLLYPFCIEAILRTKFKICILQKHYNFSIIFAILFTLGFLCVWLVFYRMPFMNDVLSINWPSITPLRDAIINNFTLSHGRHITFQNILLTALILLGIVSIFKSKRNLWLIISYLVMLFICVWCARFEGNLKHLMSGFWYTDLYRIDALFTISAIPLMVSGLSAFVGAVKRIFANINERKRSLLCSSLIVICALILFLPNISFSNNSQIVTDTGDLRLRNQEWLSSDKPATDILLNSSKMLFLDKVKEITKNDIVANDPFDGSMMAYQYNGTRVVNRHIFNGVFTGNTKFIDHPIFENWPYVSEKLSSYKFDNTVQQVVKNNGIKYVLKLASDSHEYPNIPWTQIYDNDTYNKLFNGIITLNDSIPGFEVVLEEGDMRLYKIDLDYFPSL